MLAEYKQLLAAKIKKLNTSIKLELEGRTVNPPGNISYMLADIAALEQLIERYPEPRG